jgi:hypothetical protein
MSYDITGDGKFQSEYLLQLWHSNISLNFVATCITDNIQTFVKNIGSLIFNTFLITFINRRVLL